MAKTLAQLNKKIEKLQREAAAIRKKELATVIDRIQEAVSHYGLTAKDLGFETSTSASSADKANAGNQIGAKVTRRKPRATKKAGVIRFRDEAGNTWTGHGKRPGWFKAAIEAGKSVDELKA